MDAILGYFVPLLIGVVLVGAAVITAGLEFAEWLQRRMVRKPRPSIDGFAQNVASSDGMPERRSINTNYEGD